MFFPAWVIDFSTVFLPMSKTVKSLSGSVFSCMYVFYIWSKTCSGGVEVFLTARAQAHISQMLP